MSTRNLSTVVSALIDRLETNGGHLPMDAIQQRAWADILRDSLAHDATPDLLAALHQCLDEMAAMHSHYHPSCGSGCPCNAARDAARTAIAKAEGDT